MNDNKPRYTLDYGTLAERVKGCRRLQGISQQTLAERADLATTSIAQFESNRKQINLLTFLKICNALDVDANLLISGGDTFEPIDGVISGLLDKLNEKEKALLYPILTAIIAHRE